MSTATFLLPFGHLVHLLYDAAISKMRALLVEGVQGGVVLHAGEWIGWRRSCMAKWFILVGIFIRFCTSCVNNFLVVSQLHV